MAGARTKSAILSVASDGTVALATLHNRNFSGARGPSRVLGAVWRSGDPRSARWRVLSLDPPFPSDPDGNMTS